ncbi:MAG: GNAT family N-acetyltransferase [Dehalococcoidales bacterium]|nr:GNAT family N-acetyltransferase [Dehalococcoidales bacterium]
MNFWIRLEGTLAAYGIILIEHFSTALNTCRVSLSNGACPAEKKICVITGIFCRWPDQMGTGILATGGYYPKRIVKMIENITCRKAGFEEIDTVLTLLKEAALWLREKKIDYWQEWIEPPAYFVDWIKQGFSKNQFFLVEKAGKAIGCFRLQWEDEMFWGQREEQAGYVHSFTVSRDLAGRGIGYQVLSLVETLCRENGKNILRLDCGAWVPGIRKYYEGYGFKPFCEADVVNKKWILYEKKTG